MEHRIVVAVRKFGDDWFEPVQDCGWYEMGDLMPYLDEQVGGKVRVKPIVVDALRTPLGKVEHFQVIIYTREGENGSWMRKIEVDEYLAGAIAPTVPPSERVKMFLDGHEQGFSDVLFSLQKHGFKLATQITEEAPVYRAMKYHTEEQLFGVRIRGNHADIPDGEALEKIVCMYFVRTR